jgi:hypothetical protein
MLPSDSTAARITERIEGSSSITNTTGTESDVGDPGLEDM